MTFLQKPYDRERKLMPVLMRATQQGIRVNRDALIEDEIIYTEALSDAAQTVRNLLGTPNLNLGSPMQLAAALTSSNVLSKPLPLTPKGNPSTAKDVLVDCIGDQQLIDALAYVSSLDTCLGTFIHSWISFSKDDGRVHPEWNQVRDTDRKAKGTKTGRLSSSKPNFQNVPNEFKHGIPDGFPALPFLRSYCLPEEGHLWVKRDFSSQEIRILAHFEDGMLMEAYQGTPELDPHEMIRQIVAELSGTLYDRKDIKITGFSIVYGSGKKAIAQQLGKTESMAGEIKSAFLKAVPGVRELAKGTGSAGRRGDYLTTWGGRRYYAEEPQWSYRLLNYLIQGSAADQTKQCINDWHYEYRRPAYDQFLATVHDEINISVHEDHVEEGMENLRLAMDQPLFDVPMRSEGFVGKDWYNINLWSDKDKKIVKE
jgi:DNA polymerase I